MAKGLNKEYTVNLAFTADTGPARNQLQELQNSLTRLVNTSTKQSTGLGLTKVTHELATAIYTYPNSALGILDSIGRDYSNLNLDATEIQKKLADPENLTLLKNVVEKLG